MDDEGWRGLCRPDPLPRASPGPDPNAPPSGSSFCEEFFGGIGGSAIPDAIPVLRNNPALVGPDDPQLSYLLCDDRVIGLELDGTVIAIPLNIGWHHEIVNLEVDGRALAITYCPLTGSALAFDREAVNGANFLVSGWLVRNNLVMFDAQASGEASLWPQMSRGARCSGPREGTALPMIPIIEMTWEGWRSLHPDTRVVAGTGGPSFYHRLNTPYPGYLDLNSGPLFDMPVDRRRPTKERVLGVPEDDGGIAFPFGELDGLGATAVVQSTRSDGSAFVVLWDGARQAAMAYRPVADGESLTLEVKDGVIVDVETGSTWEVDGRARSGPLDGEQLEPIAYVTTVAGIGHGMELWLQLPVHRVHYRDNARDDSRIAIGDPRFSLRIGGELLGLDALPVSIRAGLKLPGSDFPVNADLIPVSDGQTDFELAVEAAHVLAGAYPLQLSGWAGYRWRFEDTKRRRKPGDERFARLGAGGPVGAAGSRLRWQLSAEGLWGKPFETLGLAPANSRRTLVQPPAGTKTPPRK